MVVSKAGGSAAMNQTAGLASLNIVRAILDTCGVDRNLEIGHATYIYTYLPR